MGVAVAATTAYDNQPPPPQPHSRQLFRLPLLSRRRLHHFSKPAIPQTGLFPNYPIFSAYFPSELGAQNRKKHWLKAPFTDLFLRTLLLQLQTPMRKISRLEVILIERACCVKKATVIRLRERAYLRLAVFTPYETTMTLSLPTSFKTTVGGSVNLFRLLEGTTPKV